jgi:hypothetical protein
MDFTNDESDWVEAMVLGFLAVSVFMGLGMGYDLTLNF